MKQITIRGLSDAVARVVRRKAEKEGLSLNRSIVLILEEAAGQPGTARRKKRHHDLDHLVGAWNRRQAEAFDADLADQRRVEEELWKAAE